MQSRFSRPFLLRSTFIVGLGGAASMLAVLFSPAGADDGTRAASGGQVVTRRLTPEQYQAIIADVFGPTVKIGGRFDATMRVDGLLEVGASRISVSPTGMEQYDAIARSIAEQIMDPQNREVLLHCKPKSPAGTDEACARQFLGETGRLLFRRPLSRPELDLHVAAAGAAAAATKNFYTGLSLSLAGMLSAPQFLFRKEAVEPDPAHRGAYRLDSYAKAARMSFFLWNAGPDQLLLDAAEKGELNTPQGLHRQIERMLASPRLEAGMRAFFADMLHFDEFASLVKDTVIYPKFGSQVGEDAREQTLKTLVARLLTERSDYRDIFTTKKTFLTKSLAAVYKVPFTVDVPNGSPDGWRAYEFPGDDPRAGILMHVSFVALHSHPGRSSPTIRGKALREIMLCQKVPAPPADVKFDIVQDTSNPVYKTARDRLTAHGTNPVCAGCHKVIDPMGLALENFDGGGAFRTTENGVTIDTSGELDGIKFTNAAGLGKAVHDNPAVPSCLVDRMTAYALGRSPSGEEATWTNALKSGFAKDNYIVPELMRRIVSAPEFYRAVPPEQ